MGGDTSTSSGVETVESTRWRGGSVASSSNQKTLPLSTTLSTPIVPPISSTRRLVTTRPIPVPSSWPASCPSRLNGANSNPSCSGERPAPVSETLIRIRPDATGAWLTLIVPPGRLYLTAFDSRLISTCFNRVRSAWTKHFASKPRYATESSRFCACTSTNDRHSSITSSSSTASGDSDTSPDSMTLRSRISLISLRRCHPDWRICRMLSICVGRGGGASDSSNCAKPRMALRGLRSSWLMLERKSDFARLACSAANVARCSSRLLSCKATSNRLRSVMSRAAAKTPCNVRSRSWKVVAL